MSNWDDGFDSRMAEAAGIPKPNMELAAKHGSAPPEWVRGRQDAEDYLSKGDGK